TDTQSTQDDSDKITSSSDSVRASGGAPKVKLSAYTKETFEKGNVFEADLRATLATLALNARTTLAYDERLNPGIILQSACHSSLLCPLWHYQNRSKFVIFLISLSLCALLLVS